jgi:hypothetical protein
MDKARPSQLEIDFVLEGRLMLFPQSTTWLPASQEGMTKPNLSHT